jgi:DNA polymerase
VVRVPTGFMDEEFIEERVGGELRFWGVDTETRQYIETSTYGGKLTENATQGGCACILRRGLVDLNLAGYGPIGSVHDEPICEIEEGFGSEEEVRQLLCAPLKWAPGLPLEIENHVARRYRK